jgi:hypothetical protein
MIILSDLLIDMELFLRSRPDDHWVAKTYHKHSWKRSLIGFKSSIYIGCPSGKLSWLKWLDVNKTASLMELLTYFYRRH